MTTPEYQQSVRGFREAAIADGWEYTATYDHEPIERASRLKREGFVVSIISRDPLRPGDPYLAENPHAQSKHAEYSMAAWGPDGLSVRIPIPYSWEKLRENTQLCGECGKAASHTQGVAFCNRVCDDCLSEARAKYETRGWCD